METKIVIGEYISSELSEHLSSNVTRQDLTDVHRETGVSASNLNQIKCRNNIVSERSSKAISKLIKRAYKNADAAATRANKSKEFLKEFLDCI